MGSKPRGTDRRRAEVVDAALREFARRGYPATTTAAIARQVGVSQPYLYRLFPTKHAIFTAAVVRCFDLVEAAVRDAAAGPGQDPASLGERVRGALPADGPVLLCLLQTYALAPSDPAVGALCRRRSLRLWRLLTRLTAAHPDHTAHTLAAILLLGTLPRPVRP
ncbi:TetR/AcrR family transcriptional regulator [Streptomyces sp. NPDC048603]|uniref:TetR/AcrR family transcriptional regulator n=1 Tax=Streptomyces sp. NPDC048603 TaxID=3365577 RepID=UPI003716BEB2